MPRTTEAIKTDGHMSKFIFICFPNSYCNYCKVIKHVLCIFVKPDVHIQTFP